MKSLFLILFFTTISSLRSQPSYVKDIPLPAKYHRIEYDSKSFPHYLQNLPLKKEAMVFSYQGKDLSDWYDLLAVIDKPLLFHEDLEQCADFTMRLWADYNKITGLLPELYLYDYSGRKKYFRDTKKGYNHFLRNAFVSSNSYSLKKGATTIRIKDLQPGDLFVQNETGGIGHVSIVLDAAKYLDKKLYLIGFGFMPAQEMHIEKAPPDKGEHGWFRVEGFLLHLKEKYPYGTPVLRRF